jgi:hypothetical protein
MNDDLAYDLDRLAVDVFRLSEEDTVIESLTGAHGMTEAAASCAREYGVCSGSCSVFHT